MQAATAPGISAGQQTESGGAPVGLEIELNGAPHRVASGAHLQDLIDALELTGQALALAVNRQVVPRQQWAARSLAAGDKVDIVRAIGGG